MGFLNPIVGGGGALVRPAIKSPNYSPGVAGWTVNRDGGAEFNDLVLRGVFRGLDYVVSQDGIFFYTGVPAAGNMAGSWAPADGTDPYGNAYVAGLSLYSPVGKVLLGGFDGQIRSEGSSGYDINIEDGQIAFSNPTTQATALIIQDYISGNGSLTIGGGTGTPTGKNAALDLHASAANPTAGQQDSFPRVNVMTQHSGQAHLYVSGALVQSSNDGQTGETWHVIGTTGQPAYSSTNWAGGSIASSRYAKLQYRNTGLDSVNICGTVHATAALAAGSYTLFTLSGAYVPKSLFGDTGIQVSSGDAWKSGIRVNVDSTGSVGINTPVAIAINDGFYFNVTVPLGNLA